MFLAHESAKLMMIDHTRHFARVFESLVFAAFAVLAASCTSTTVVEPYYRPSDARVEQAYLSPNANFGVYKKLMASPLEIYYPDDIPPPDGGDLLRLRNTFRTAFLDAIGKDYTVVTEPGPDVMRIVAQIVDLKITGPQGTFTATGRLKELVTRGQLTLLLEFRDSLTDRVFARAGETEHGESSALTAKEASWEEVETAARHWAGLLRQFLDKNLGKSS